MQTNISHTDRNSVLTLEGSFDLSTYVGFRNTYRKLLPTVQGGELLLDMGAVDLIDSSGLGMLLLLQKEAVKNNVAVALRRCQPFVLRVLTTANFHTLLKIQ